MPRDVASGFMAGVVYLASSVSIRSFSPGRKIMCLHVHCLTLNRIWINSHTSKGRNDIRNSTNKNSANNNNSSTSSAC